MKDIIMRMIQFVDDNSAGLAIFFIALAVFVLLPIIAMFAK